MSEVLRKPKLPRHFFEVSNWAWLYWTLIIGLSIIVPSAVNYYLLMVAQWPLYVELPVLIVCFFIASQGFHLSGWAGHEGFHLLLHKNRLFSCMVGIFLSSITVVFLQIGVAIDHFNHHRYTNTEKDPDYRLFAKFKTFWSRILLTRNHANRIFMKDTIKILRNQDLGMDLNKLPFPMATYRKFAYFNIFCNLSWLTFYGYLAYHYIDIAIIFVFVPLLIANFYSGMRPYIEHNGTGDELTNNARTRTSIVFKVLYFGNSYHLEHHLYPAVPCYKLPAVHEYLKKQNFYSEDFKFANSKVLDTYKYVKGKYRYGVLD